jgi:hypothetical protein
MIKPCKSCLKSRRSNENASRRNTVETCSLQSRQRREIRTMQKVSKAHAYSMLMMGPGLGWTRHYKCLVQEAYKQPQSTFEIRFRDSKDQATTLLRVNIETTNKHSQVWGSQTLFFTVGWITSTTMNRCRDQRTQPRIVVTRACMLSIDKHRKHNYLTTLSWIHSYLTESWGLKTWWL